MGGEVGRIIFWGGGGLGWGGFGFGICVTNRDTFLTLIIHAYIAAGRLAGLYLLIDRLVAHKNNRE